MFIAKLICIKGSVKEANLGIIWLEFLGLRCGPFKYPSAGLHILLLFPHADGVGYLSNPHEFRHPVICPAAQQIQR
jgi:hypothetical protein